MPKICMLTTGHAVDDDRIFYKETVSLAKRYRSIVMIAPHTPDRTLNHNNVEFVYFNSTGSIKSRLLLLPKALISIYKLKPRVCHLQDFELIFIIPFIRLLTKTKIIYDSHEAFPEMILQSDKFPNSTKSVLAGIVGLVERSFSKFAHHIITADSSISEYFKTIHSNVTTLYNYPVLSIFQPDSAKMDALQKQYENRELLVYHGGMSYERGLFHMIEAMNILKNKKPEVLLLLIGNLRSFLEKQVRQKIREYQLHDHIKLLGFIPHKEIVNYLSISKVGLVPLQPTKKFLKNIPIKQFEYMACGLPVAGANIPPVTRYIASAGSGQIFDSTNSTELANTVIDMLNDTQKWRLMSAAGKDAIQKDWNWGKMEKKLFAVYDDLLTNE